jgi:hypothetical protein
MAARTAATLDVTPLDLDGGNALAVGELQPVYLDAVRGRGAGEPAREVAVHAGEHAVARRQRVDDGRLPRTRPRAGIENQVPALGLEDLLEPVQALLHEGGEARAPVVDHGLRHRANDALGDERRSGDLQERPAGHGPESREARGHRQSVLECDAAR